jgi:hypothetical protein
MSNPPSSYEYLPFAVLPAKTIVGTEAQNYVAGIPKALIEEYCEQNPDSEQSNYFHVVLHIFELERNQQEIALHLTAKWGAFETTRLMIDDFELPHTLPEPDFTIWNDRILIWDNQKLGATLRSP